MILSFAPPTLRLLLEPMPLLLVLLVEPVLLLVEPPLLVVSSLLETGSSGESLQPVTTNAMRVVKIRQSKRWWSSN